MDILTIQDKTSAKFLKKKAARAESDGIKTKAMKELVRKMRTLMRKADGVGLSANQIGADIRLFVAEVPAGKAGGANKFYAIFNPEILRTGGKKIPLEEGCLSVPNTFGTVERPERITLSGFDVNGKKIKIKAWGLLARVFQHEVDHLNGVLFIEKAKNIQIAPKTATALQN